MPLSVKPLSKSLCSSGDGSGCGGANGHDNSEESAFREGKSVSLVMLDDVTLCLIMHFLPQKEWGSRGSNTILPAVFAGARNATSRRKREHGYTYGSGPSSGSGSGSGGGQRFC